MGYTEVGGAGEGIAGEENTGRAAGGPAGSNSRNMGCGRSADGELKGSGRGPQRLPPEPRGRVTLGTGPPFLPEAPSRKG